MNIQSLIGKKIDQTQSFLVDGRRVPLTRVWIGENAISQVKHTESDGYMAVQLAFDSKKKIAKPISGHIKKAGIKTQPRFLREVRVSDTAEFQAGVKITPEEVFQPGDRVDVIGTSKGKGFAGAVKRWNFKGGPKTHGQSDRHRAPGSIGQGTTPGRVYKGKKMAGRMGNDRVTIKNLEIIEVKDGEMLVKGLVPGLKGGLLIITKTGANKNYQQLYTTFEAEELKKAEEAQAAQEDAVAEAETEEVVAEVQAEESAPAEPEETKEEKEDEAPVEEAQDEKPADAEEKEEQKEEK